MPSRTFCAPTSRPVQYDAMAAGYEHRADRAGPLRWMKHEWNRRVFAGAAAHAPWSTWVRDSLVADYGVAPERIEVVPPGVDTATWDVAEHGEGPMRVLFVGGDFASKGGDLLLRAMAALDDSELRVVTRSEIERQPRVEAVHGLTPNDPALRELFRTSDVFVLPSRAETFGIAAVEAAAAGLPVVVTNIGGLADLVVDGTTGFSIEPGDGDGPDRGVAPPRSRSRATAQRWATPRVSELSWSSTPAATPTGWWTSPSPWQSADADAGR